MNEDLGPADGLTIVTCYSIEEFGQLEKWIRYHSQLVGLHNLHVLRFGEKNPASKKLSPHIRQGLRVFGMHGGGLLGLRKPLEREDSAIRHFERISAHPPFKLVVFLDLREFIVFHGAQGIGTNPSWIRKEINRLVNANRTTRIQWGFDPHPTQDNAFHYVSKNKWILSASDCQQAGPGWMSKEFSSNELDDRSVALEILNTSCISPSQTSASPIQDHLALLCDAFRDLLPNSETSEHTPLGHKPIHLFELLDGPAAFKPESYLQCNPDVQSAGVNALAHFVHHGYLEGRLLSNCSAAWHELHERLYRMRQVQPDGRTGYCNLTNAAFHTGRLKEVGPVLEQALATFEPTSLLLYEHALWAVRSTKPIREQILRWERFRLASPENPEGYHGGAAAHLAAGNDEQATQLIREGLDLSPAHQGLLALADEVEKNKAILREAGLRNSEEARQILKRFESMGWSCEFGIVQRRFGLEQVGLLRFTNMTERSLVKAFEDEFKGFSDSTEIKISRHESNEYLVHVPRYTFGMHTFITDDHIDVDALQARMARQLSFLRKKFLEDLDTDEKIFVQLGSPDTTLKDLQLLAGTFRKSSTSCLLCVRVSAQDADAEQLTEIAPGVLLGHISRRGIWPGHQDIDHAGWLSLCKKATEYFSAQPRPVAPHHEGANFELHN